MEKAIEALNKATDLAPDYARVHYNLDRVYSLKHQKEAAIASLQKAITLDKKVLDRIKTHKDFRNIRESPELEQLFSSVE